ncbi:MAG TPA: GGDEF domain-containing protein [Gaiellaceae bacterium]|nr:GGDEF domain-containing protein [Gaiellaceae bacterium]
MSARIGLEVGIPAALVLVGLTALAEQLHLVAGRRTRVSLSGPILVAAALVGGPLVGACAGASTELVTTGDLRRKRVVCAVAGALQGFVVGLVGAQLSQRGVSGAVIAAAVGLAVGFVLNLRLVLRALGPGFRLRRELRAARRPIVVSWFLPAPLLVVFLYLFPTAAGLALAFASGLLLVAASANRFRRRLERTLAGERSRARVDALTSAPNRYALAEALTSEQARISRGGRTAALCFLDLDRFKAVNDTYGYAAGDRLLVDVHNRLRGALRASDLVFRWGGEEFVVLAPHVNAAELADFAERLRLLLATRPFAIDGRPRTVTGSVGAVLLDDSRAGQDALEAASRLVKKAKQTRNAAAVEATPPSPGGRVAEGGRRASTTLLLGTRPAQSR